jgi:hypothetical protein
VGFVDKDTFAHLGKIVVEFYEVELLGKGTGFGANCAKAAIAEAEKSIDERAKKAQITHSVKWALSRKKLLIPLGMERRLLPRKGISTSLDIFQSLLCRLRHFTIVRAVLLLRPPF